MRKGSHHTAGAKQKMRVAHAGQGKGKVLSAEHRQKISEAHEGKTLSVEHRRKIGEAGKGRVPSAETRQKLSEAKMGNQYALGHRQTEEHRRKIGAAHEGKALSAEHRQKISVTKTGEQTGADNPSWRGGVSFEPYPPEFNEVLRRGVRERDGHRCQTCGVPRLEFDTPLHVHHIDRDKQNSALDNLQTLCRACHGRVHWSTDLGLVEIELA